MVQVQSHWFWCSYLMNQSDGLWTFPVELWLTESYWYGNKLHMIVCEHASWGMEQRNMGSFKLKTSCLMLHFAYQKYSGYSIAGCMLVTWIYFTAEFLLYWQQLCGIFPWWSIDNGTKHLSESSMCLWIWYRRLSYTSCVAVSPWTFWTCSLLQWILSCWFMDFANLKTKQIWCVAVNLFE